MFDYFYITIGLRKEKGAVEMVKKVMVAQMRNASKRKYNSEHYGSLQVFLDKDIVRQFKNRVKILGISQTEVIRYFVEDFLMNYENYIVYEEKQNKVKKSTYQSNERLKLYRLESEVERMMALKTDKEIYDHLHRYYINRSKLKDLAQHIGIEVSRSMTHSDIAFSIYRHFADRLDQ